MSLSGDVALVGAFSEDERAENAGAAYVFRRVVQGKRGEWVEEVKLTASDGESGDLFGWSVSISGEVVLVGAFSEDERGNQAGAAYVGSIRTCPGDVDGDGLVGFDDLLAVLAAWGSYDPCPPFIPEDIDRDCEVGFSDLLILLAAWGPCE